MHVECFCLCTKNFVFCAQRMFVFVHKYSTIYCIIWWTPTHSQSVNHKPTRKISHSQFVVRMIYFIFNFFFFFFFNHLTMQNHARKQTNHIPCSPLDSTQWANYLLKYPHQIDLKGSKIFSQLEFFFFFFFYPS